MLLSLYTDDRNALNLESIRWAMVGSSKVLYSSEVSLKQLVRVSRGLRYWCVRRTCVQGVPGRLEETTSHSRQALPPLIAEIESGGTATPACQAAVGGF